MARPEVGANRGANRRANGREINLGDGSGGEVAGVSQVRDNVAGPEGSPRSLAVALVELAIQILGDEKLEEERVA